jgi:hypothetical protein
MKLFSSPIHQIGGHEPEQNLVSQHQNYSFASNCWKEREGYQGQVQEKGMVSG